MYFLANPLINHQKTPRGENFFQEFLVEFIKMCSDLIKNRLLNHDLKLINPQPVEGYTVHSETEMNKGYADIYIQPNVLIYPEMCPTHFIVELKYLTKADLQESSVEKLFNQAKAQLEKYGKDRKAPTDAVKLIALTTNEQLLLMQAF